MKNNLTGTLIERAIKRAWPQSTWTDEAIKLLEVYQEGEVIESKQILFKNIDVFFDLATAGIIEMTRSPKYKNGMFAGFKYSFRYKSDLNY